MTDYIKRTDAVKIAEKYGLANGSVLGRHTGLADCIARDISGLPAADVVEVVHAKWIPFHSEAAGDIQYCSACDIGFDARMDYCPHCGARMDGWMEDADNGE